MVFNEGTSVDHSLPCSLWPTTFFGVFGKNTPLAHSLPCLKMARHWAFLYRTDREHLTGPFGTFIVVFTRACHWNVGYLVHKGHAIGPFAAVLSNDHRPSQFSLVLNFLVSDTYHKQNHLKKKDIYVTVPRDEHLS